MLRLALRNGREAHVSCSVESDALELLQGRLRGASVKGRDWASRLGLTARFVVYDIKMRGIREVSTFRATVALFSIDTYLEIYIFGQQHLEVHLL